MASYDAIRRYVRRQFGFYVSDCSIAHVKELCGLDVRRAPNRIGRGRQNPCPQRHRAAIRNAFRHFRLADRAPVYTTGMEHSPTSATGTGWEHAPWHATQRAAWEALKHTEAEQDG